MMGSEGRSKGKQLLHIYACMHACMHAFKIAFRFTSVNYAGRGNTWSADRRYLGITSMIWSRKLLINVEKEWIKTTRVM